MSRVIKMSTPRGKPISLPKTAALTKAQTPDQQIASARSQWSTICSLREWFLPSP
jgi:hypothetical protein